MNTRFCGECGGALRAAVDFCTNCGRLVPPQNIERTATRRKVAGQQAIVWAYRVAGVGAVVAVLWLIGTQCAGTTRTSTGSSGTSSSSVSSASSGGVAASSTVATTNARGGASDGATEKAVLDRMSHAIKSQESDLADLSSRVDSLKSQLQKTQRQYPNGAPQAVIDKYDADRTRLNRMIAQYNSGFDDYTTALSEYNRRVAAYNAKYAR